MDFALKIAQLKGFFTILDFKFEKFREFKKKNLPFLQKLKVVFFEKLREF